MMDLLIFVFISTIICTLIIEAHCRLQQKIIAKPRTKLNLAIHYFVFVPYFCFLMFFLISIQSHIQPLELTELKESLAFFGSSICFVLPVIYIMGWRYPDMLTQMESWRKNT